MSNTVKVIWVRCSLGLALVVGVAPPVCAVDGVVEINQARALASGGFPVVISEAGSYRLSGNLTVPDANTDAIHVTHDDVTIDLNGFSILGHTVCSGSPVTSCTPTGFGIGIFSQSKDNITVVNGTVRGMGNNGIDLSAGSAGRIENVRAVSNGLAGIGTNAGSTLIGNTAQSNGSYGISAAGGSTLTGNTARSNGGDGISTGLASTVTGNTAQNNGGNGINTGSNCTVIGNSASSNTGYGLNLATGTGYANNVVNNNTGGTVFGGVQMGTNICTATTTCP